MRIVETAEDIDPSWLTAALRSSGHLDSAKVTAVSSVPIGTGQVANCARLTIAYNAPTGAPASLIAKTANTNPALRETIAEHLVYDRECGFYRKLAPTLGVDAPRLFYVDHDVERVTFVLLLEDMSPAEQGDQIAGCSVDVATAAVEGLVGLHAPRWGDPSLAGIDWLHGNKAADRQMRAAVIPRLWAGFKERYGAVLDATTLEAGEILTAGIYGYFDGKAEPGTVVHGDYRLDNLLIGTRADGTVRVTAVDWQTCTTGPALDDVAYFLGSGLPTDLRRQHEETVVRGYHERVLTAGVREYDWERCWTDYRRGTWAGLLMAIYASMIVERTERGDRMFMTMADRHARHALDLDAAALIA